MARQLKVFSTAAGFVNAVVAAPSQKAALEAWGVRDNLFASGTATVVTDPDLIAKALATPGEIVRVPISTDAGFLAAARAPVRMVPAPKPATSSPRVKVPVRKAPPPPPAAPSPPDRSHLTNAERALTEAEERRRAILTALDDERAVHERRRSDAEKAVDKEVARAESARNAALKAFRATGGSS